MARVSVVWQSREACAGRDGIERPRHIRGKYSLFRSKQVPESVLENTVLSDLEQARQTDRLLAAVRDTIAEVPYCWVMTQAQGGGVNARVVRDNSGAGEVNTWTRWFLARPDSRKLDEIRLGSRVTLAYQHDSGNAYVTLLGRAGVIAERPAVEARLRRADDPDGSPAVKLIAVGVTVDRIEVHVRGVTAPPWGYGRTLLERDQHGIWRLLPD
jgi:general stress protein 26